MNATWEKVESGWCGVKNRKIQIPESRNTASIKRVNGRGETMRDCKDVGSDSAFFELCSKVEGETRRVKLPSAIGRSRTELCDVPCWEECHW